MKVKLSVYKNDQLLEEVELEDEFHRPGDTRRIEFFVGRSEDCHVILDHPQVSRHHAVVTKMGDKWEISKISAFGPLMVNGSNQERKDLANGDILSIGPFVLHVSGLASSNMSQYEQRPSTFSQEMPAAQGQGMVSYSAGSLGQDFQELTGESQAPVAAPAPAPSPPPPENPAPVKMEDDLEEMAPAKEEVEGEDQPSEEGDSLGGGHGGGGFGDDPFADTAPKTGDTPPPEEGSGAGFEGQSGTTEENANQLPMEGGGEGEGDDKTRAVVAFAQYSLKIFGDFAPYDEYIIKDDETFIGRDKDKCQIVLNDPEVSTIHAVIKKTRISITIEDMESSNGTILNGARINQADLNKNDEFVIGSTSFTVIVKSDLLQAEDGRLMPVEENQEMLVEEVVEEEVDFAAGETSGLDLGGASGAGGKDEKSLFKNPQKRKKLIYAFVGLVLLYVLFGEEDTPKGKGKGKNKGNPHALKKEEAEKIDEKKALGKKKLTLEEKEALEASYQLAKKYFSNGEYEQAEFEINKIFQISDEGWKNAGQMKKEIAEAYKQILAAKEKKEKEEAEKMRRLTIDKLVTQAREATKEKQVELAEGLFVKILELDPEQSDVSLMKMELDAWRKEKERKELEKIQKEAERKRKVGQLSPGKNFYLKKEWFRAINKLEEFLRIQDMDEDLIKEGSSMLDESKTNLQKMVSPLLGKARSLKEGQDLKGSYEYYLKILKIDPSNLESLNEMSVIRETLEIRLRKIYREAIISESLSLFSEAKEKFQEVQQISPTDSEYYKKATEKLKNYLD